MSKHTCTYCQNIILDVRVKCVECSEFDLCLQCFACGAEAGQHKKDHDYQMLDCDTFSVFESGDSAWTCTEEMLLLEGVEQYGFGNWDDIAAHIRTKNSQEAKDHYFVFFIHGSIGKVTFPLDRPNKVIDHTGPLEGPLSPSITTPLSSVELTPQEQKDLAYMPLRDDFEREFDNDAEQCVSSLAINYDDEDVDIAFKLAQVSMYRERLKERKRRKRITREYNLINAFMSSNSKQKTPVKKKGSKDEREFQERTRLFAQFHTAVEHKQYYQNLQREKHIKSRIKELMRYRKHGVVKLDECDNFEEERQRRERIKENNKKKMIASAALKRQSIVSRKAEEKLEKLEIEKEGDLISPEDFQLLKNFTGLPGNDLLSKSEKTLCRSIGMKPGSYITIKTSIIKDYLQRRQGLPVKLRYPSGMDKTHRRKILNFLQDNGWIAAI